MLHKKKILQERQDLGRIESRHIHYFARRGSELGKEATDHIYSKVAERLTGATNQRIFGFNEAYDWQISNEPAALSHYMIGMMDGEMVSDVTIVNSHSDVFCSIPTGLHLKGVNQKNPDEYIAEPIFCKCPYDQDKFILLKMCQSPADVKKHFPKYYWRILDYMDNCNCSTAKLFGYHPLFPEGTQTHCIEFKSIVVWEDMYIIGEKKDKAAYLYKSLFAEMQKQVSL